MENRRLIVLFATCFSAIFAVVYYLLFTVVIDSGDVQKRTLYMNQVGLYEKKDSIEDMMAKLDKAGLKGYTLKQEKLTAVVCSVSTDVKTTRSEQEKLKELKYSYIQKSVTVEDPNVVKLIDDKEYAKALERIGK